MVDHTSPSGAPIEALLEERARFQQWLAKLESTAGTAPSHVREKVRTDYLARLQAVIDELKSHAETIQSELERHQGARADLDARKAEAEERLAEAEVRHLVGEYAEEDWERLRGEATTTIESLQGDLDRLHKEIGRLVEVQGLIAEPAPEEASHDELGEAEPVPVAELEAAAPAEPRPAPPIEMLPDPTPDVAAAAGEPPSLVQTPELMPPMPGGAPRFVPKPGPEPARGRPAVAPAASATGSPVDELAFLKSVGGDDRKGAPRRSGESARPEVPAQPVATAAPQPSAKPGQASQAKTLKCGECGTLNRPTEWYCERCGAELAAL